MLYILNPKPSDLCMNRIFKFELVSVAKDWDDLCIGVKG